MEFGCYAVNFLWCYFCNDVEHSWPYLTNNISRRLQSSVYHLSTVTSRASMASLAGLINQGLEVNFICEVPILNNIESFTASRVCPTRLSSIHFTNLYFPIYYFLKSTNMLGTPLSQPMWLRATSLLSWINPVIKGQKNQFVIVYTGRIPVFVWYYLTRIPVLLPSQEGFWVAGVPTFMPV